MWKTKEKLTSRRRQTINFQAFGNLEIIVWAQLVREICCSLALCRYSLACQPWNMVTHIKDRPLCWLWGLRSTRKQKNLTIFCSMLWVGANSQKCGVICGIKCGNLQHIRMLQMTPHFLNASVAEQNISTLAICNSHFTRRTLNRYTKRPLQDSAIFFSTPGMEESAFYCANHRVSRNFLQPLCVSRWSPFW